MRESCPRNGHGKSLIWSWKVMEKSWNLISKVSWEPCFNWYRVPSTCRILPTMSDKDIFVVWMKIAQTINTGHWLLCLWNWSNFTIRKQNLCSHCGNYSIGNWCPSWRTEIVLNRRCVKFVQIFFMNFVNFCLKDIHVIAPWFLEAVDTYH